MYAKYVKGAKFRKQATTTFKGREEIHYAKRLLTYFIFVFKIDQKYIIRILLCSKIFRRKF